MKKRMIIIISILIVLGIIIFFIFNFNRKTEISNKQTIHDVTFFDSSIKKKGKKYIFNVKLVSDKDLDIKKFHADIKDKNGKTLDVLEGILNGIKKDETIEIEIESSKDLKKAYKISYSVYSE